MTPAHLARYFGVPLIDYRREGDALLVASGCGIMMTVMDLVPRFRWCIDADCMRRDPPWRIELFMQAIDLNTDLALLGVVGWFSLDSPAHLRAGLARTSRMFAMAYSGGAGEFEGECTTLDEFVGIARSIGHRPETQRAAHRYWLAQNIDVPQ